MQSKQERTLFEYAVIRYVPLVDREEFLNVGVILYCPKQKFLASSCAVDEQRLIAFSPAADLGELKEHLNAISSISAGDTSAGPIARLDQPSRFRWLTAARSTIVQTSRVHPGLCVDAEETLVQIFADLVATDEARS